MWSQIALISSRVGAKHLLSCYGYEWLFHAVDTQKACRVASISKQIFAKSTSVNLSGAANDT
jgi:hypothetical protein